MLNIFLIRNLYFHFLLCSNKSGTIEESLSVTNEDINLRKQEINHMNLKHKQEVETCTVLLLIAR